MSADNLLYVMRRGDKFVGLHLSASCDYVDSDLARLRSVIEAPTLTEALLLAHREVERSYYEYGVSLEHGLTNTDALTTADSVGPQDSASEARP